MSTAVVDVGREVGKEVDVFDPRKTKTKDAKLDALIDYAKRVKEWALLEQAVAHKIEEQAEFVGWWDDNITVNKGGDRKSENQKRSTALLIEIEHETGLSHQTISRWRKRLEDPESYRAKLFGKAYKEAFGETANYKANKDTEDEWYTPAHIIAMVREVLGEIDLDPASNAEANKVVCATKFFTAKQDGLKQEWHGRVWLNPPYSRDLIRRFVAHLIQEYTEERTTAAIMVSHNVTETKWFQGLASVPGAVVCFPSKRIQFYRGNDVAAPVNGQAFFYLGQSRDRFQGVFDQLGIVMERYGAS